MSTNGDGKIEGEYIPVVAQNVAIGTSIVGGAAATTVGVIAAGTSATSAISAAGAAIGGVAGGVIGSSVGLATGGVGMAATVPFATAGAAIGGWVGLGQPLLLSALVQHLRGQSLLQLAAVSRRSLGQRPPSISTQKPEHKKLCRVHFLCPANAQCVNLVMA